MTFSRVYKLETASEHFQKALAYNDIKVHQKSDILIKLALIEEEKENNEKSFEFLESALKLNHDLDNVYCHLAWHYYKLQDLEKYELYMAKIQKDPSSYSIKNTLMYIKLRTEEEN